MVERQFPKLHVVGSIPIATPTERGGAHLVIFQDALVPQLAYREGTLHSLGDGPLSGAAHLLTLDADRCNTHPYPTSRCITLPSDGTTWWFPPMDYIG